MLSYNSSVTFIFATYIVYLNVCPSVVLLHRYMMLYLTVRFI
jgi:hypothetical protein